MADRKSPPPRLALLVPALIAGAIVWLATEPYGPGLSPDSVQFLAAARALAADQGWMRVEGTPFVEWAPLLPAWLALGVRLEIDPLALARVTGALSAAGIAWAGGMWVARRARSRLAGMGAALALALWFPLLYVSAHLWSDAPYLFFCLLGVLALGDARERPGLGPVLQAALLAALACLTRYLGVTLVAAGAWYLFAKERSARRALVYAAASGAPLALWLLRSILVSGTAAGLREPPGYTFLQNARDLLGSAADALLPWSWSGELKLVLVGAFVAAGWRAIRRRAGPNAGPLAAFVALYALAVLVVASIWGSDRLDLRFALPLCVALVCGMFVAGASVKGRMILAALALAWVARLADVDLRHVALYRKSGVPGFADARWRASPTLALLRERAPAGAVYSNAPEAAYLALGRPIRLSPRAHLFYAPGRRVSDLDEFVRALGAEREATLVWFDEAERTSLVPLATLKRYVTFHHEERTADGAICHVTP